MNKKKIIVFHPALAPYRIDFFNELSQRFDATFYFSLSNLKDQKFNQDKLRDELVFNFNLLTCGFEFIKRSFRFGIFRIIHQSRPDIVLCSEYSQITMSVLLYKIMFRANFKVYTISDDSVDLSIHRSGLRKLVRDYLSHFLEGVIFPSLDVCNWYSENVNGKTKTLELPIIHSNNLFREKLSCRLKNSHELISRYKLEGKKVFLFVGRLVKIKNPHILIESFARIRNQDDILIIIGDGEEWNSLNHMVSQLGLSESCLLLGRYEGDELLTWFNIAQCLILPSSKEPYGVVVNEALLAGCKVICSRLAGASSLVNKNNGYLFDPRDKEKLEQIIGLVSDKIEPLALPLVLRDDLMPFTLNNKLEKLFSRL